MAERTIGVGVIGGGLMGREFASAAARWVHLAPLGARPAVAAVCDVDADTLAWYERLDPLPLLTNDYHAVLAEPSVEAIYCAVPHHLHEEICVAALAAGKHLLAEKPVGIDLPANEAILGAIPDGLLVRCSSELPFYPGGQAVARWLADRRFGRIVEARAQFLHSSDLDPRKPINWKRMVALNGAYGCLGDLGMHVLHLPLRAGWQIVNVRAILSDIVTERPGPDGAMIRCGTWDNAVLLCEAADGHDRFPLRLETKRIAPGEMNTWTIEIDGLAGSIAYSTKKPKTLCTMSYEAGGPQEWRVADLGYTSAYPAITGSIFEFGFPDAVLQMWAAFCDELAHGLDGMLQPFYCATPEEAAITHRLFTAALRSHEQSATVSLFP
jgi:predicted dehydrogenase